MIAVGTDIVAIDRVERVWRRHGARFGQRILTDAELRRCTDSAFPWRYLAKRFAAKEAIAKCLGCGIGVSLSWQDITVVSAESGEPLVKLSPRAVALAGERGGARIVLSISDERDYAVAFAALVT